MPAMPVALIGKRETIFRLIRLPQHLLRLVHDVEKLRVEMAEQRRGHRGENARMGIAGTGAEQ